MGYPMTWQRLMNRNVLQDGDYHRVPLEHQIRVNVDRSGLGTEEELRQHNWPSAVERLRLYESRMGALLGDIRRLETDARDERTVCGLIAVKTNLDPDTVAAVLKEFFAI